VGIINRQGEWKPKTLKLWLPGIDKIAGQISTSFAKTLEGQRNTQRNKLKKE